MFRNRSKVDSDEKKGSKLRKSKDEGKGRLIGEPKQSSVDKSTSSDVTQANSGSDSEALDKDKSPASVTSKRSASDDGRETRKIHRTASSIDNYQIERELSYYSGDEEDLGSDEAESGSPIGAPGDETTRNLTPPLPASPSDASNKEDS